MTPQPARSLAEALVALADTQQTAGRDHLGLARRLQRAGQARDGAGQQPPACRLGDALLTPSIIRRLVERLLRTG